MCEREREREKKRERESCKCSPPIISGIVSDMPIFDIILVLGVRIKM